MKWVGLLAASALIVVCFFPWVFIESKNIIVTGVDSKGTSFGKPGYFHFVLGGMYLILCLIPRIWAKRVNILLAALNSAWAVRNYLLISACSGGECPEKRIALYILFIASLAMLVAALLPEIKLKGEKQL
jgi:hypothetical protein